MYGLLGSPVGRSRSPELHNRWFAEHDLDAVYVAFPTHAADPTDVVRAFRTLGLAGANVTALTSRPPCMASTASSRRQKRLAR